MAPVSSELPSAKNTEPSSGNRSPGVEARGIQTEQERIQQLVDTIRGEANTRVQHIIQSYEPLLSVKNIAVELEHDSLEELGKKLQALSQQKGNTGIEHILQSWKVVHAWKTRCDELEKRLEDLDKAQLGLIDVDHLIMSPESIKEQDEIFEELDRAKRLKLKHHFLEKDVMREISGVYISELTAIAESYKKLGIGLQTELQSDLKKVFFESTILPNLLKLSENYYFTPSALEIVISSARKSFLNNESITAEDFGKTELHSFYQPFQDFMSSFRIEDEGFLFLASHLAANEVLSIREKFSDESLDHNYYSEMQELALHIMSSYADPFIQKVTEQILIHTYAQDNQMLEMYEYSQKDIESWSYIKESPLVNQLFSQEIESIDAVIFPILNESALSNHREAIQSLRFYPNPESVRTLLILGINGFISQNSSKMESYFDASSVMKKLMMSNEWPHLVERTLQMYPQLVSTKDTLLSIDIKSPESPFFLMDLSLFDTFLIDQLINSENQSQTLRERIVEASSLPLLLQAFYESGKCTKKEYSKIVKTISTLQSSSNLEKLNKSYSDFIYADVPSIIHTVSQSLYDQKLTETLKKILLQTPEDEDQEMYAEDFQIISKVTGEIAKQQHNGNFWKFLRKQEVIDALFSGRVSIKDLSAFLNAHTLIPELALDDQLLLSFSESYMNADSANGLRKLIDLMPDQTDFAGDLMMQISHEFFGWDELFTYLHEMPEILKIGHVMNDLVRSYADFFLPTEEDRKFLRDISSSYSKHISGATDMISFIQEGIFTREEVLRFPKEIPALLTDATHETRDFLFANHQVLIANPVHFEFVKKVAKEFGGLTREILQQYLECVEANILELGDQELILEFVRRVQALSPETLMGYKQAKKNAVEEVFFTHLLSLSERMSSGVALTEEDRKKPYYRSLIRYIYPNHTGIKYNYEAFEFCEDRSFDLSKFSVRPRYEIDTLKGNKVRLQSGVKQDVESVQKLHLPLRQIELELKNRYVTRTELEEELNSKVDEAVVNILTSEKMLLSGIETVDNLEEKILIIALDSLFGSKIIPHEQLKQFILLYDALKYDSPDDYALENAQRISEGKSLEYGKLLQLNELFTNSILLYSKNIVQKGVKNDAIRSRLQSYFTALSKERMQARKDALKNRMQIDKLGMSDSFLKLVGNTLRKRRNRLFSKDEISRIISRYESLTGGLSDKISTSPNATTRAFYGQLRTQREQTFRAMTELTGIVPNPSEHFLGAINIAELQDIEQSIENTEFDEEAFSLYLVQRIYDLFEPEQSVIENELNKFESEKGYKRESLHAYITKTKESAYARLSAGVCISEDNPTKDSSRSIWNLPNFFQLILQDPKSHQCMGAVFLHYFDENEKKILFASLNPSSTYLLSHDEASIYHGIRSALELFAKDNDIDYIVHSENESIRTNRRDGEFEQTMNDQIHEIGQKLYLDQRQFFSVQPEYSLQRSDVVWIHPKNK